jgi:hypothetical protein
MELLNFVSSVDSFVTNIVGSSGSVNIVLAVLVSDFSVYAFFQATKSSSVKRTRRA